MTKESVEYEKYRRFVKETLEKDYDEVVKLVNCIFDEVRQYETLLLFLNKIKVSCIDGEEVDETNQQSSKSTSEVLNRHFKKLSKFKPLDAEEPLKTHMNIGKDIFCEAVVDRRERIIVKLYDDVFAELNLQRAEEFITKKIELLNERAGFYEREAHSIRARIHLILSSVKQLENL